MIVDHNVLLSFTEVAGRLADEVGNAGETDPGLEHLVDAFLMAAGLDQMCQDYLHRDFLSLSKVGRGVGQLVPVGRDLASKAAFETRNLGSVGRALLPAERAVSAWHAGLSDLLCSLSDLVCEICLGAKPALATTSPARRLASLGELAAALMTDSRHLPGSVLGDIVRLPNCFRSFDQRPSDCQLLVDRFSSRWPDRTRPTLVLGLRTSGSYLAPLTASLLRAAGYASPASVTMRPGQRLLAEEKGVFKGLRESGGIIVVVDDCPRTGDAIARAAVSLQAMGFDRAGIVLMLQLQGNDDSLPSQLRGYPNALLPWDSWSLQRAISETALKRTISDLLLGRAVKISGRGIQVGGVENLRVIEAPAPTRGHAEVPVEVELRPMQGDTTVTTQLQVEGVGVGYLGRDAMAVGQRMSGLVPEVYGTRNGLLVRERLPAHQRLFLDPESDPPLDVVEGVVEYVWGRKERLSVKSDASYAMSGRGATWEAVAGMLADAFGRARPMVLPLCRAAARRLLATERPSLVDGDMAANVWFRGPAGLRKANFAEAFSTDHDDYCFDAAFDLAALAAENPSFSKSDLCSRYLSRSGEVVDDERWLLYMLYHLHGRSGGGDLVSRRRASALVRDYLADLYLPDLAVLTEGPICAIDVDGVLETRWLGFPAPSPTSALALRALNKHGYRTVLATGRSLCEVRERCRDYRLAGGVAEYGAVIYDHVNGRSRSLLDDAKQADLAKVRAALSRIPDVTVDPLHYHSIRAYNADKSGLLGGMGEQAAHEVTARAGVSGRVAVVDAESQTDFVAGGVDKGHGLRELIELMGPPTDREAGELVSLAIGDTASDLPMLDLARLALAPVDAEPVLRTRAEFLDRPCQFALLEAVSRLLAHQPRGCAECRPRAQGEREQLLVTVLDALGGRKSEKLRQARALALRLRRESTPSLAR